MTEPAAPSPAVAAAASPSTKAAAALDHAIDHLFAHRRVLAAGHSTLLIAGLGVAASVALTMCGLALPAALLLMFVVGPLAFLYATITVVRFARAKKDVSVAWLVFVTMVGWLGGALMALVGFWMSMAFSRGRQVRRFGRAVLPTLTMGDAFTRSEVRLDVCGQLDATTRGLLAERWRENGKTEHASVAAFALLTGDLMALGAPPSLLVDAQKDALDEIRHAELCFSLARALDGQMIGPAAFPVARRSSSSLLAASRTAALARLAVDSLVDGALHEGLSARVVAKLARRCEDGGVRAILRAIAADEGRHARHGWDVARWCALEGGAPVLGAMRGAFDALPRRTPTQTGATADGRWERYGLHGDALFATEHARAMADLEGKLTRLEEELSVGRTVLAAA